MEVRMERGVGVGVGLGVGVGVGDGVAKSYRQLVQF
jgi:hypothetical protein